jgi:hypothetical protein
VQMFFCHALHMVTDRADANCFLQLPGGIIGCPSSAACKSFKRKKYHAILQQKPARALTVMRRSKTLEEFRLFCCELFIGEDSRFLQVPELLD